MNSPVPTFDVGKDSPRQFFQVAMNTERTDVAFATMTLDVPAGKVLVIERVSFRVDLPPGQKAVVNAFANCGYGAGEVQVPLSSQGIFNGEETLTGTAAAQLLAGGPNVGGTQDVLLNVRRTESAGTMFFQASVTGYYLDVPGT